MLFRGASSMLRRQDPSAIEQRVDLGNLARKLLLSVARLGSTECLVLLTMYAAVPCSGYLKCRIELGNADVVIRRSCLG